MHNTVRYWETRRIFYNVALTLLVIAWLTFTWPHFQPAMTWLNLGRLAVLGLLANVCYSVAYPVDLTLQSAAGDAWRKRRWLLWLAGTLFALLFACYWIADEIYPYVGS